MSTFENEQRCEILKSVHQHTIVVEWMNIGGKEYTGNGYSSVITGARASKLMCVCGDIKEIDVESEFSEVNS